MPMFHRKLIITSSVQDNLTFLDCTKPNIGDLFDKWEKSINDELLSNLLKIPPYKQKYPSVSLLPITEGSLNILKPQELFKYY